MASTGCEYRDISHIRWSHDKVHDHFRDERSIYEAVFDLMMSTDPTQKVVHANILPPLEVVKYGDGEFTLSNTRLQALRKYQEVLGHLFGARTVLAPIHLTELGSGKGNTTWNNADSVEVSRCRVIFASQRRGEIAIPDEKSRCVSMPPRVRSWPQFEQAGSGASPFARFTAELAKHKAVVGVNYSSPSLRSVSTPLGCPKPPGRVITEQRTTSQVMTPQLSASPCAPQADSDLKLPNYIDPWDLQGLGEERRKKDFKENMETLAKKRRAVEERNEMRKTMEALAKERRAAEHPPWRDWLGLESHDMAVSRLNALTKSFYF